MHSSRSSRLFLATALATAMAHFSCSGGTGAGKGAGYQAPHSSEDAGPAAAATPREITIIGTNDLHGHIEMLPLLGGYLEILRQPDERLVLLVDGGDMFQGTLESNLQEGAPIVEAYNLLGYNAATIGNHEFDFGPVGEDATVREAGQDPRGALKARAKAASFPFLASNILNTKSAEAVDWPNVQPATLLTIRGAKVGILGVSTFETPHVTLAANFVGLSMAPLVETITEQAQELRNRGAELIIVAAHAGGICESFEDPKDLSSCAPEEIFEVAQALPEGTVDVIVAGHTHRAVAHEVNGIAIIESFSRGAAFGRVDFQVEADGSLRRSKIHQPRPLCADQKQHGPGCDAGSYEGNAVKEDQRIAAIAARAAGVAEDLRSKELGIELASAVTRSRATPSALGNLFADLMLAGQAKADLAITNGGSLRADLPAGPLHYGALFEAMPFDNRFALVTLRGETLRKLIAENLRRDSGILSISGMRASAVCKRGKLLVTLRRKNGTVVRDNDRLLLATSDYIASGGDGLLGSPELSPEKVEIDGGLAIRDSMAQALTARGGTLDPSDPILFSSDKPRIEFAGERPLSCQ